MSHIWDASVCVFFPVLGGLVVLACRVSLRANSLHMWVDGGVCTWWHFSLHVFQFIVGKPVNGTQIKASP